MLRSNCTFFSKSLECALYAENSFLRENDHFVVCGNVFFTFYGGPFDSFKKRYKLLKYIILVWSEKFDISNWFFYTMARLHFKHPLCKWDLCNNGVIFGIRCIGFPLFVTIYEFLWVVINYSLMAPKWRTRKDLVTLYLFRR